MHDRFAPLETEGRIERTPTGLSDLESQRAIATRDLSTAESLQNEDRDNALAIAYTALRAACTALMAAYGFRAKGDQRHRTLIEFARITLPELDTELGRVDRLRRRRHRVEYDAAGRVSEVEVEEALRLAKVLVPRLLEAAFRQLGRD